MVAPALQGMRILRYAATHSAVPAALTLGNFDGVHLGHRAMLSMVMRAAQDRQLTSCVMTFEPHPRDFFAPERAPARLTSLREKLEQFAALGLQRAHVRRFHSAFARISAEAFIEDILVEQMQVRWLLVGDDFHFGAGRRGDIDMLQQASARHGFEVVQMPSLAIDGIRVSSTAVRERLAGGDLTGAARLLGRPYSISGRVMTGDGLGRELGFPTANVQIKHNSPALRGIFVVEVVGLQSRPMPGVASLGTRPTVKPDGAPVLEVHLLDFSGDLYGRRLQVSFLHKLRDEEKYPDLPALQAQIARDAAAARQFFRSAGGAPLAR